MDQSARGFTAVQGAGRQVPDGAQVRRPPSHRALPQLQGKKRAGSCDLPPSHWC